MTFTTITESVLTLDRDGLSIPATFTEQSAKAGRRPAVLLLHGTASKRDEVGGMYSRLAAELADNGVSSLRIDFAGCGDSERAQTEFTITSEVADAIGAFDWLASRPLIDATRIGVVGFSQGGLIAALLAAQRPELAAMVSWSSGDLSVGDTGAGFAALFDNDADLATMDAGFTTFTFSRQWWNEFRVASATAAVASFAKPMLAIAGGDDDIVDPGASQALLAASQSTDATLLVLPGADHIFNVLDEADQSGTVINTTVEWLRERLGTLADAAR